MAGPTSQYPTALDNVTTQQTDNPDAAAAIGAMQTAHRPEFVVSAPGVVSNTVSPDVNVHGLHLQPAALTANLTVNNPVNMKTGHELCIEIQQDGTGGRTITWGTAFRTTGIGTPTTTANQRQLYKWRFNGTNWMPLTTVVNNC